MALKMSRVFQALLREGFSKVCNPEQQSCGKLFVVSHYRIAFQGQQRFCNEDGERGMTFAKTRKTCLVATRPASAS